MVVGLYVVRGEYEGQRRTSLPPDDDEACTGLAVVATRRVACRGASTVRHPPGTPLHPAPLTTVSRTRHCRPGVLALLVCGELDWAWLGLLQVDQRRRRFAYACRVTRAPDFVASAKPTGPYELLQSRWGRARRVILNEAEPSVRLLTCSSRSLVSDADGRRSGG